MPIEVADYVRPDYATSDVYAEVRIVAERFLWHLREPDAQGLIEAANLPGYSSALVQEAVLAAATPLGSQSEAKASSAAT